MVGLADMPADDPCGLGRLLPPEQRLHISSALSDRCAAIAAMFNALGECENPDIVEACKGLVTDS